MAEVLPFPLARRRDLIVRQAAWYAEQGQCAAERNLRRQLAVQLETLLRRGVHRPIVEAQVLALEGAIRAEVWRLTFSSGGAA